MPDRMRKGVICEEIIINEVVGDNRNLVKVGVSAGLIRNNWPKVRCKSVVIVAKKPVTYGTYVAKYVPIVYTHLSNWDIKMNMKLNRSGLSILTVMVLGSISSNIYADGYRNPAPTSEGMAKAGANMIFVDDASAISYNPANLAFQTNASIVVSVSLGRSENTFNSASPSAGSHPAVSTDPWQALPNLYVSMPVTDSGISLGLGITTPFGQGIAYDKNDLADITAFQNQVLPFIHEAQIALININPTVAFRLGENIAVGVGVDIFYSQLYFKQYYPWSEVSLFFPNQDVEADGDGYGFGGNLSLSWNVTEKQRMAFSYRSEVKVGYEGDLNVSPNGSGPPVPLLVQDTFNMDITYPQIVGVGYGIELTENIQVEALLEWLGWSVNDTLSADLGQNGTLDIPQQWDDTFTVAFGGSWQFAEDWVLRCGYSFIETPIPDETMTPILPDTNRHVFGLGLGYAIGRHTVDLSYAHTIYEDRTSPPGSAAPGTYEVDSNLLGLTYSASF